MQGNPCKKDVPDLHQSVPGFHRLLHAQRDMDQCSIPYFFHTKAQASSPPLSCPEAEGRWEMERRLGEANGSTPILHQRPFLHRRKQSASRAQVPQAARRFANALSDPRRVRTSTTTLIQLGGFKKKKKEREGRTRQSRWLKTDTASHSFLLCKKTASLSAVYHAAPSFPLFI